MARKRVEINKVCGERLRSLLKKYKMNQQELADEIGYTKEHISFVINGKRNLTPEAAEAIVEIFPDTRIGWLLGYEDYETDTDLLNVIVKENLDTALAIEELLLFAAKYLGYQTETTLVIEPGMFQNYNPNEIQGYLIKDNTHIAITSDDVDFLVNEVARSAVFILEGLIHKKNDSWHPFYFKEEMFGNG